MFDCAVIGTGVAGLSAVLTLKSLNKNYVWIGSKELSSKIKNAERINNFPGLSSVSGEDMCRAFKKQIADGGIEITEGRVTGVYDMGGYYGILCDEGTYEAKSVILATGVESVKPIKGELEFVGRGVSYCATCDGFLYKGKKIAVITTSKDFAHEVEFLASLAEKVYVCAVYKDASFTAPNIELVSGFPSAICGGLRVEKLVVGEKEIAVDGVFCLKSAVTPSVLVSGLEMQDGHVVVDRGGKTSLSGIYAAGDCVGRPYQYAKAAGEGNVAAHSVNEYLSKE